MKIITLGLLTLTSIFGQGISLAPPKVTIPPQTPALNEYVEKFPAAFFVAGVASPVTLSKTPKVGTVVEVYLQNYTPFVKDSVLKTADPLTVTLNADQVVSGATLVVVYKSVD